jgi:ubiquinone biosynthesis protein
MLQIASFLSLLITAALVAFFARRILGAPIGWPRAIIIGVLM